MRLPGYTVIKKQYTENHACFILYFIVPTIQKVNDGLPWRLLLHCTGPLSRWNQRLRVSPLCHMLAPDAQWISNLVSSQYIIDFGHPTNSLGTVFNHRGIDIVKSKWFSSPRSQQSVILFHTVFHTQCYFSGHISPAVAVRIVQCFSDYQINKTESNIWSSCLSFSIFR